MWIYMFVLGSGVLTLDIKTLQLEFNNKAACIAYMEYNKPKSKPNNIDMGCISKDTGEVIKAWQ